MFAFGCWAGKKMFLHKKGACQNDMKTVSLHFFLVLLNGPVQNALFCLMDRYRNVCVWFMARNCRFPELELLVPNLGTRGYHCKELPVPTG